MRVFEEQLAAAIARAEAETAKKRAAGAAGAKSRRPMREAAVKNLRTESSSRRQ